MGPKKWPLYASGRYSEVNYVESIMLGGLISGRYIQVGVIQGKICSKYNVGFIRGHCRQEDVIGRWSLEHIYTV